MIMTKMPPADLLPHSTGPYVALMIAGFVIAAFGHLSRSRWLITIGILVIFLAAAIFPLAVNLTNEAPEQPGPVPRPY
jgi:mannose/fructose/N-acetylgalactosamine-specific phosphotransferase system component IIC